jgi:hypothetical protein
MRVFLGCKSSDTVFARREKLVNIEMEQLNNIIAKIIQTVPPSADRHRKASSFAVRSEI